MNQNTNGAPALHGSRGSRRVSRRRWASLLAAFSLVVPAAVLGGGGLLGRSVAHAEDAPSDDDIITKSAWGTTNLVSPLEFYTEIPLALIFGYPMSEVVLTTPAPKCEVRAAGEWSSYPLEEGLIPGNVPGADTSPDHPKSTYHNPTLAWAANPPYTAVYGEAPVKSEAPNDANKDTGPYYTAECPTALSGKGSVRQFGVNGPGVTVGAVAANNKQDFVPQDRAISSDAVSHLTNINAGGLTIRDVGSWLHVTQKPEADPTVSYRLTITGISAGSEKKAEDSDTIFAGDKEIVLAGQNVPSAELVKQFNDQLGTHEKDLAALGRHNVTLMAPRSWVDDYFKHHVESPFISLGYAPTVRKNATGQFSAVRLGMCRYVGSYRATDSASLNSSPS